MVTDSWNLTTTAMLMMQPMILMERICKEAVSALNLPANRVIAAGVVEVVVEDLEGAMTVVEAAEDLVAATGADQEVTHLDQGLTTDWSWKTCLHVHLGRT